MNILALDLATKTGWAAYHGGCGGAMNSGMQDFSLKRGESAGMKFLRFRAWLDVMQALLNPIDVLYYEQAHHRGGAATQSAYGLITDVLAFAAQHNIQTSAIHTGTLKKYATGRGNAKKPEMIEAARKLGFDPKDDNEADAILIREFAMWELLREVGQEGP